MQNNIEMIVILAKLPLFIMYVLYRVPILRERSSGSIWKRLVF